MRKQIINDLTAIDKILDMADERLNELINLSAEKNFLYFSAEEKAEWEMENLYARNEVMRTKEHYQKRWDEILGRPSDEIVIKALHAYRKAKVDGLKNSKKYGRSNIAEKRIAEIEQIEKLLTEGKNLIAEKIRNR
jgi:hypothetical protein